MLADAPTTPNIDWATPIAAALERLREARPLVQNITNFVSMDIVANALLALGASPAMVHAREELDDFGAFASALVVNIGTLSGPWVESMLQASAGAHTRGTPWILDPVGAGATRFRNDTVTQLMQNRPTILRGNASEILAVATALGLGNTAAKPKGVDSMNTTDEAAEVAVILARGTGTVVVASGAIDVITDGRRVTRLANGSPLMTQVTAVGCSLSAIAGAFAASTPDAFAAAVAAVAVTGIAGELAARDTTAPGSFRTAFIDRLATIDTAAIRQTLTVLP